MKKNSGSALTSVIVVFLLVTMISVPLLGTVVYNYRLREYDSGLKEAEYRNEIVMDRVATIIRNEVIAAISSAKEGSTEDISSITDTLINSYNSSYDAAYDSAVEKVAQYDENNNITNHETIKFETKNNLISNLKSNLGTYEGVTQDEIIGILDLDNATDLSKVKINEEIYNNICNNIFKTKYKRTLLDQDNGIFKAIYRDKEYKDLDLADNRVYGSTPLPVDDVSKKTKGSSLRVTSKYERDGDSFKSIYENDEEYVHTAIFDDTIDKLEIGIETKYKASETVPLTTLSATFVIGIPDFTQEFAIQQQTIALSNPTLDYGLIVGDTLTLNGKTLVDGNLLARANGDDSSTGEGIRINEGASLEEVKNSVDISDGRIATSGDIIMEQNTVLVTGNNPIYYRNLYIGDPNRDNKENDSGEIKVTFNGDVLAKDDLEIDFNSKVVISQPTNGSEYKNYFGYNDNNETDEGPDSSSAIVINSDNINNLSIGLGRVYLAGRAFIDGVRSTRTDKYGNPYIYKTGESLSVKGNYIAYQTPIISASDDPQKDYDANKVKFSPYFMKGNKNGIDQPTDLTINLVDRFIDISNYTSEKESYSKFDTENKWEYFVKYSKYNRPNLRIPNITIANIGYIEGAILNSGNVVGKSGHSSIEEQGKMINQRTRFEAFTSYFGYYPEDTGKRKNQISEWIKFDNTEKTAQFTANNKEYYTYISKKNAGHKKLAWGNEDPQKADVTYIKVTDNSGINGLIFHDGDLTITSDCSSEIPFKGTIIVTGNLIIEDDVILISDKDSVSEVIINNYLNSSGYSGNSETIPDEGNENNFSNGKLDEGDLFNSFTYDGSGTTYVAVDITDRSNMININELVGIKDWKKS